ncbi:MAG: hypothetical protein K8J08_07350 [Thermoanaerobaculia bacterium]|nr:hypothetical protein [Thermoanaerobaculia bacterium]
MASIDRKQPSYDPLQSCPSRAKYSRPLPIEDRGLVFDEELEFGYQGPECAPVLRSSAALFDHLGRQLDAVSSLEAEGGQQHFEELLVRADGENEDEQLEVRLTTLYSPDPASLADPAEPASWRSDPDATVVETSFRVHSTPEAKEEALRRFMAMAESEGALVSFVSPD